MKSVLADRNKSAVLAVDIQPSFLKAIVNAEQVVERSAFLLRCASILEIPILATDQYRSRMGGTDERIRHLLPTEPHDKLAFSCCGAPGLSEELNQLGVRQVALMGIETHICINQTAHDLLARGLDVIIAGDAVSSNSFEKHNLGLARLRDAGCTVAHTESIVYEWLRSADHPKFRDVLALVKMTL